jgi:hypothetical protein
MREKQKTCQERVQEELEDRMSDLRKLWRGYQKDPDKPVGDLGTFNEYGLCFDYVAPGTFNDQKRGYFRYQLSWGGPSDEFRFYCDENFNLTEIEYWFLDWFDGASVTLSDKDCDLLEGIFDYFKEMGSVQAEFDKSKV